MTSNIITASKNNMFKVRKSVAMNITHIIEKIDQKE